MLLVETRAVERELAIMLMTAKVHRAYQVACDKRGDSAGVARCEQMLELDDVRIRKYCRKHGLDLSIDALYEDAE